MKLNNKKSSKKIGLKSAKKNLYDERLSIGENKSKNKYPNFYYNKTPRKPSFKYYYSNRSCEAMKETFLRTKSRKENNKNIVNKSLGNERIIHSERTLAYLKKPLCLSSVSYTHLTLPTTPYV